MFARIALWINILFYQLPLVADRQATTWHRRILIWSIASIIGFFAVIFALTLFGMKLLIPIWAIITLIALIWVGSHPRFIAFIAAIKAMEAGELDISKHSKLAIKDIWSILGRVHMALLASAIFTTTLDFIRVWYLLPLFAVALIFVFSAEWFWNIKTKYARPLCFAYAFVLVLAVLLIAIPREVQVKYIGFSYNEYFGISKKERLLSEIQEAEMKIQKTSEEALLESALSKIKKDGNRVGLSKEEKDALIKVEQEQGLIPKGIKKAAVFTGSLFEKIGKEKVSVKQTKVVENKIYQPRSEPYVFNLKAGETTDHWIAFPMGRETPINLKSADYKYIITYIEGDSYNSWEVTKLPWKNVAKFKLTAVTDQQIFMTVK